MRPVKARFGIGSPQPLGRTVNTGHEGRLPVRPSPTDRVLCQPRRTASSVIASQLTARQQWIERGFGWSFCNPAATDTGRLLRFQRPSAIDGKAGEGSTSMQQPVDALAANGSPAAREQFILNASLGRNDWWRWVVGILAIIVVWLGSGLVASIAGCAAIDATNILDLTCASGEGLAGDGSLSASLAIAVTGFAFGLIAVWGVAKLLHRQTLRQVVTGRKSIDLHRYFCGALVALIIAVIVQLVNRFVLQLDFTYQAPDLEYLVFALVAIVLVPIQAGYEEVFFRGYILQGLSLLARNRVVVAIAAAVIFMLPHLSNPEPWEYGIAPYAVALVSSGLFFAVVACCSTAESKLRPATTQ